MRALHLHHDPNSLPGLVGEALDERGVEAVTHQVCHTPGSPTGSTEFPDPTSFDLVVVYGSRWSVVRPRRGALGRARARAAATGRPRRRARAGHVLRRTDAQRRPRRVVVAAGTEPEVGWFEVRPASALRSSAGPWLQWHFDVFEVPDGRGPLADLRRWGPRRSGCVATWRPQFHPEADRGGDRGLVRRRHRPDRRARSGPRGAAGRGRPPATGRTGPSRPAGRPRAVVDVVGFVRQNPRPARRTGWRKTRTCSNLPPAAPGRTGARRSGGQRERRCRRR